MSTADPCRASIAQLEEFLTGIIHRWKDGGDRKQLRSRRREQEILQAAVRVFARDGVSRSRIGDIAAEAGIPISTIYEYYDSKEQLAYAVPLAKIVEFLNEFLHEAGRKQSVHERLQHYLWLSADFARRNPEWARVLYLEIWPSVLVSESTLRHCFDDFIRIVIFLIRQGESNGEWPAGPNVYETAAILNGSINQIIITAMLYRRPRNLSLAAASCVARTMTLLHPQPPQSRARRA